MRSIKNCIFFIIIILYIGCSKNSTETNTMQEDLTNNKLISDTSKDNNWIFIPREKFGEITKNTKFNDLIAIYGANNIQKGFIAFEDQYFNGCLIFPNTTNQVEVYFENDNIEENIEMIIIRNKDGKWRSKNGVFVGLELKALVEINKAPISFYGFEWSYQGVINSLNGGELEKYCKLGNNCSISLQYENVIDNDLFKKYIGDIVISTNDKDIHKFDIKIDSITINFNN